MSLLGEANKEDDIEFFWGRKIGVGARNKDVQFYESFTYDGVEYFLYDCVYMWQDDEPEPYIGKLVKIWETGSHQKIVKVVWFFRPIEIKHWLGDVKPLRNEIFLASGEGKGLFNLSPLEAISGKCRVLCTSKDKRNSQASTEEVRMADYVFYRTFDVGRFKISDKFGDAIAGIEVEYFFNHRKDQGLIGCPEFKTNLKQTTRKSSLSSKPEVVTAVRAVKNSQSDSSMNPEERESNVPAASMDKRMCFSHKTTILGPKNLTDKIAVGAANISFHQGVGATKRRYSEDLAMPLTKRHLQGTPEKSPNSNISVSETSKLSKEVKFEKASKIPDKETGQLEWLLKKRKLEGTSEVPAKLTDSLSRLPLHVEKSHDPSISVSQKSKLLNGVKLEKPSKIPGKEAGQPEWRKGVKTESQLEVTRRPTVNVDTSKWFKQQPWEDRLRRAQEQGSLVLLENLNPSFTSSEVEEIVWHAFKEKVSAKMIQGGTFSSPQFGQAFVIFKTKVAAESAISDLNQKCLILGNGRPVIGRRGKVREPGNSSKFVGHLVIANKFQRKHKDQIDAVSTSHFSQPNTIEYEMAVEWLALQEKSIRWWDSLRKQQAKEIGDVRRRLKVCRASVRE